MDGGIGESMSEGKVTSRDSICYDHNHLADVIARVDFLPELAMDLSDLPEPVKIEALKSFRVMEGSPVTSLMAKSTSTGLNLTSSAFRVEKYFGLQREKRIEIAPGTILTSYHEYSTYSQLRQEFFGVLKALASERPQTVLRRIGFRFINIIPHPSPNSDVLDWHGLITPGLIGSHSFRALDSKVIYSGHRIEYMYPDHRLVLNYGMHNADYPAPIAKKEFVLDLDASCEDPELVPKLSEADSFLDKLHETIQNTFEAAITEEMRDYLGRKD